MNNFLGKRHGATGLWALFLVVCTFGATHPALTATVEDNSKFSFRSRSLLTAQESCPNGVIDPGETNTVRLTLRKLAGGDFEEVKVEFVAGVGNVDFTVTPASIGTVSGDAGTDFGNVDVRFRAGGKCGEVLRPVIRVSWKSGSDRKFDDFVMQRGSSGDDTIANNGDSARPFRMGAVVQTTHTFTNSERIVINDFETASDKLGKASVYPSKIVASGVANVANPAQRISGDGLFEKDTFAADGVANNHTIPISERVRKAIVKLNGVTHPFSQDLNIVLESPWGERYAIMKQAGGANSLNNATLTFDSDASAGLPSSSQITTGTYKTADYNTGENNLPDAPSSGDSGRGTYRSNIKDDVRISSDVKDAQDPNGSGGWKLYVQDDTIGGTGEISGGWTLTLITEKTVCCGASDGAVAPFITEVRDDVAGLKARLPGIANRQMNEDAENLIIKFSVNDAIGETGAGDLSVTAMSGNQSLIEDSQLVIEKITESLNRLVSTNLNTVTITAHPLFITVVTNDIPDPDPDTISAFIPETINRQLKIKKLVANQTGTAAITITVTDGSGRSSSSVVDVQINAVNDVPTISDILGQAANVGQATLEVPFTVSDIESEASSLVPTVESSNTTLVPIANVFIRGSGGSRTVQVQPVAGQPGNSTITVKFTDPQGGVGSKQFKVDFTTTAGDPTFTPILDTSVEEDKTKTIPIIVRSNSSTAVSSITINATATTSSGLIPLSSISVIGSSNERNVVLTPLANQVGSSTITLVARDPGNSRASTNSFVLTVTEVNDPPSITAISDQTINEDGNTGVITFTVSDVDDSVSTASVTSLTVTSLNTSIVPNTTVSDATATAGIQVSTIAADGTVTLRLKPSANAFGRAAIQVHVEDDSAGDAKGKADRFFNVIVNPVNDPPEATTVEVREGTDDDLIATANIVTKTGSLGSDADTVTPTLVVKEDPKLDGDLNAKRVSIRLSGLSGGPGELNDQTARVNIAVAVDVPDKITGLSLSSSQRNPSAGGSSDRRVDIRFTILKHWDGEAVFTVTLTDELGASTVRKFKLDIQPVNDTPSLSDISNRTVAKQTGSINIPISISDVETRTPLLSMSASASVANFVSTAVFDAANTTLSIVKGSTVADGSGNQSATITVTGTDRGALDDGSGPTSVSKTFVLTFTDNRPPTMTFIASSSVTVGTDGSASVTIPEDGVASVDLNLQDDKNIDNGSGTAINVTVENLTARSSNTSLVNAASNVLFSRSAVAGSEADLKLRRVRVIIIPTADAAGTADVIISARDEDQLETTATIKLTVTQTDDPPTIAVQKPSDGVWSGSTLNSKEDANPVQDTKTSSKLIEVKISDPETSADSLELTATSGNTTVIPNANITVSSTGATRTLTVKPAANENGSVAITVTVRDNTGKTASETFTINVAAVNDEPTADSISDVTVSEDSGAKGITLSNVGPGPNEGSQTVTLSVEAKDAGQDSYSGTSSIVTLPANVVVSGSANVNITPQLHASGVTSLRFRLTDNGSTASGDDNQKELIINFTVTPINDPPEIILASAFVGASETSEISVASGGQSVVVPISIKDAEADSETKRGELVVTAVSSNPTLVPNTATSLELGGAGGSRGLIVRPAVGQFGTATITITVTDKGQPAGTDVKTASKTLTVRVDAGQNPTITSIADVTIKKNEDSPLISFTVGDAQTAAASLTVTASADNTSLVPTANIQFAPAGATREMIIRPAANQSGSTRITVTVRDGDNNTATTSFTLTVQGEAPTISAIPEQTIQKGGSTGAIPFTVADAETFPGFLRVTARSSNQVFIPNSNVVVGGSGGNRTVTVTAAANQEGSATISLTVTDTEGLATTRDFVVQTPLPVNDPPTITSIGNQVANRGEATGLISFTIGDKETAATALTLTKSSSNQALVPDGNIFLGGTGASRTVFIQPAADQEGIATITITVTDGGPGTPKQASTSFTVTVSANEAPTITAIADQTTEMNKPTSAASFTVGDKETAAASLTVAATSSNTALVPNSGIVIGGSGANRTVAVTPAANQVGVVTITVTVTDGGNKSANRSFTVTINRPPALKGDLDGDGQVDLLFQDGDGFLAAWLMNGTSLSAAGFLLPSNVGDVGYRVAATGDFNRDGNEDVVFQHTDGTIAIWFMSGTAQTGIGLFSPSNPGDSRWRVVGTADVNRDGKVDLVFQHADGTIATWFMDGTSLSSAAVFNPANPGDARWKVVGVGDLSGDGRADLVFQHSDGTLATWTMNGTTLTSASLLNPANAGTGWRVAGTASISKAFTATLSGSAERPPVTTAATGSGKLTVIGNQLTLNVTYSGLSGVATGAHIHLPATTEQTAGVAINLQSLNGGAFGTSGSLIGTVTMTADQRSAILNGQAYVNVHTAANATGEIRGQIVADSALAGKVDLLFQSDSGDLAVWFLDGSRLSSAQLLSPPNSGATWKLVAPR
ncbi:MAG: tandem-95 repeat protein [Verrucomicrobia bacterium]|nr:tandem-95 repeat protein [Verrucomicrobiota bacterium]